jgi:predicted transcriptional regulator
MEHHNLQLTQLETQVLESLISLLYAEAGYSDVDAKDLAADTQIPIKSIRGVLSSLVKKEIINIDENSSKYQLVYLNSAYWYLHPEWKSETNH